MKREEINQITETVKNLTKEEQGKLIKLDSLLKTKTFREKLKISPVETLRKDGFDIPKDAKFVFTDDDTKITDNNGKDGIYYINLKNYESGYVNTEEFKNVAGGGVSKEAITGISVAGVAALSAIGAGLYFGSIKPTITQPTQHKQSPHVEHLSAVRPLL